MKKYNSKISEVINAQIYDFNTVSGISNNILKNESVDLIVTSPPYGDSKTTVAYGQFSRLANEWLGFNDSARLDSLLMGGKKSKETFRFKFPLLDNILDKIRQNDRNTGKTRELEVVSFYKDYKSSINNISKVVKKNGIACYVVGDRRVNDMELPTDEITKFFFEENNFKHIETIVRNIPNKRMPLKTSPSNKSGKTVKTMKQEYIVIMKKK